MDVFGRFKKDAKKEIARFVFISLIGFYAEYRPGLYLRQYDWQFWNMEADSLGAIFRRNGGGNNHVMEFPRLQIHRL